jgi:hypothetical protein
MKFSEQNFAFIQYSKSIYCHLRCAFTYCGNKQWHCIGVCVCLPTVGTVRIDIGVTSERGGVDDMVIWLGFLHRISGNAITRNLCARSTVPTELPDFAVSRCIFIHMAPPPSLLSAQPDIHNCPTVRGSSRKYDRLAVKKNINKFNVSLLQTNLFYFIYLMYHVLFYFIYLMYRVLFYFIYLMYHYYRQIYFILFYLFNVSCIILFYLFNVSLL